VYEEAPDFNRRILEFLQQDEQPAENKCKNEG